MARRSIAARTSSRWGRSSTNSWRGDARSRAPRPPTLLWIEGGQPRRLPGLGDTDIPVGWTEDGRGLFVNRNGSTEGAVQIVRVDLATGAIVPWKEIVPRDVVGLQERPVCLVTPDGRTIVYSTKQYLTDLYLVEGLK